MNPLLCRCSLAEELFQKVKRMFGNPHQATEDLKAEVITSSFFSFTKWLGLTPPPCPLSQIKEKLSDHEGKLQEAQDLLRSAKGKTKQAGALAEQNRANLTLLEVRQTYELSH